MTKKQTDAIDDLEEHTTEHWKIQSELESLSNLLSSVGTFMIERHFQRTQEIHNFLDAFSTQLRQKEDL